jgi:hypothetical protein
VHGIIDHPHRLADPRDRYAAGSALQRYQSTHTWRRTKPLAHAVP